MTEPAELSRIPGKISRLFESRWLRGYVRAKLARDPVYAAVYERLRDSNLPVLDLGCGVGLLGFYLRERGFKPPVTGIDSDGGKISVAKRAGEGRYADLRFEMGDALNADQGFRGNVLLLDLLHYFDDSDQQRLLTNAIRHAGPGSMIIIRECPREHSWRYRATYLEEWLATKIGWLRVPMLNFPTKEQIASVFREKGYREEISPLWQGTPFNNHLFVFEAPGEVEGEGGGTEC